MVKEWDMDQDDLERFLAWLDPDRDEASKRYVKIQCWLIRLSRARGRSEAQAEEIADETINRVVRKVPEIAADYVGPREPYFYRVWQFVLMEPKPVPPVPLPAPPDNTNEKERRDACLRHCMENLPPEDQQLLLDYHALDGREKIKRRRELADKLGISENALRIRLCRLRAGLKPCMDKCLKQSGD